MNTYYELLGLNLGTPQIEIKKAYFKMVHQYFPESASEQFQKIRGAYERLRNMESESERILLQAEIIQKDYPDYYEKIEDFLQEWKKEKNIVYLKDSLQKIYHRLEPQFNSGYYYKMYLKEKRKA